MATHSSTLAWRIPWKEEPGGLQTMESQRVGHDWATSLTHSLPDSSVGKESACNSGDPSDSWVRKIPWRRDRVPTLVFLGFFCGSAGKESACNGGDLGSIPGLGRSPGEGKGYSLQYSDLENSMDCMVHGVTNSQIQLSNFHFYFTFTELLLCNRHYTKCSHGLSE